MLSKIKQINQGLVKKYPQGNTPFQIMTRLLEECGELAQQVNHFENSGIKNQKHGRPDKQKLAKEIQDVVRCALQVMTYYQVEDEVKESIDDSHQKLQKAGYINTD